MERAAEAYPQAGPGTVTQLRGGCFCACIVLGAVAYSFQFMSFLHVKEAVLGLGLLVLAVLGLLERRPLPTFHWFLPLWLLLLLGAAAALWRAQAPVLAVEDAVRWLLLLLLIAQAQDLFLETRWRARIRAAMLLSASLVALLGILQYAGLAEALFPRFPGYDQRVYSVFGNQDLFGGYLAVALALVFAAPVASRWRHLQVAGFALLAAGLVLSGSRTAWLAAGVGVALAVLLRTRAWNGEAAAGPLETRPGRPRWHMLAWSAAAAGLALAVLLSWPYPVDRLVGTFGPEDVGGHARLWFWDGALRMWAAQPMLGVGLGNFAYWSPYYQGAALHGHFGLRHYSNELHTQHAHSEVLELLAETGLIGAVPAVWMLARILRVRGPEWGALAALLVFSLFNAGLHSAPHALVGLTLAGLLLARNETLTAAQGAGRAIPQRLAPVLVALIVVAAHAHVTLIPSARLAAAEDAHLARQAAEAEARYRHALAHPWPAPEAREGYGLLLLEQGRPAEAYMHLRAALLGKDTGRIHLLLARAAHALGWRAAALRHIEDCLWRWPHSPHAREWARLMWE